VKRRDLVKQINQIAKDNNHTPIWSEGGNHTKVTLGTTIITVPRHNEINELTAQAILSKARKA